MAHAVTTARWCAVLAIAGLSQAAVAADGRAPWRDPMRAPMQEPAAAPAPGAPAHRVSRSTRPSPRRRRQVWSIRRTVGRPPQAWIGETRVTVGAKLGDWRVHTISGDAVVLQSLADGRGFVAFR
jgi:hypothetical protein